jgi:hypothetical protein
MFQLHRSAEQEIALRRVSNEDLVSQTLYRCHPWRSSGRPAEQVLPIDIRTVDLSITEQEIVHPNHLQSSME